MIQSDSASVYPDSLTIRLPIAVTLTGIIILSTEFGWLLNYTVETYNGSDWTTAADICNTTGPIQLVNFLGPAIARKVRINVTQDQPGSIDGIEYTRINEVFPLFDSSSSASSSTSTLATNKSTPTSATNKSTSTSDTDQSKSIKCSNAGTIAGGVIAGMVAIILAAPAWLFVFRKMGDKGRSDLPELASGNSYPAVNNYSRNGQMRPQL